MARTSAGGTPVAALIAVTSSSVGCNMMCRHRSEKGLQNPSASYSSATVTSRRTAVASSQESSDSPVSGAVRMGSARAVVTARAGDRGVDTSSPSTLTRGRLRRLRQGSPADALRRRCPSHRICPSAKVQRCRCDSTKRYIAARSAAQSATCHGLSTRVVFLPFLNAASSSRRPSSAALSILHLSSSSSVSISVPLRIAR
jgi:hypothetical protein